MNNTDLQQAALAANFQGTPTRIGVTGGTLGFFGATPVAKPGVSTDATVGAAGAVASAVDTTYTGGIGAAAYSIGGVVRSLKLLGLIA